PEDSAARPSPLAMSDMPGMSDMPSRLSWPGIEDMGIEDMGMVPWCIPGISEEPAESLPQAATSNPTAITPMAGSTGCGRERVRSEIGITRHLSRKARGLARAQ